MPRRKLGERVIGIYPNRGSWRVRIVGADGKRRSRTFPTRERAISYATLYRNDVVRSATTIGEALTHYEKHLVQKGNKPRSYLETLRRLRAFFPDHDLEIDLLTPIAAAAAYRALVDGGASVDTHRNYLAEARTFLRWCVALRWLPRNPLEEVRGIGRRRHGKKQLRIDEGRKWETTALRLARSELGAVAALLTYYLGIRASEVMKAQARDVDDGGRLFWIEDTKTEAGRRQLAVPSALGVHLRRAARGKAPAALLFPGHWRDWPCAWVQRICEAAGVPEVTAQGMRNLHASLAVAVGMTGPAIAAAMGHESFSTTKTSYADHGAVDAAHRRRVAERLGNVPRKRQRSRHRSRSRHDSR